MVECVEVVLGSARGAGHVHRFTAREGLENLRSGDTAGHQVARRVKLSLFDLGLGSIQVLIVTAVDPGRVARHHGAFTHVSAHDGARRYHRAGANGDTRKHNRVLADERVLKNAHSTEARHPQFEEGRRVVRQDADAPADPTVVTDLDEPRIGGIERGARYDQDVAANLHPLRNEAEHGPASPPLVDRVDELT